jgi:uncharacterized membrane protein
MVVTIVIAADGTLELPPVQTPRDMKRCLQALGKVQRVRVEALEVLWTPQAAGDSYALADYPDLLPLQNDPVRTPLLQRIWRQ